MILINDPQMLSQIRKRLCRYKDVLKTYKFVPTNHEKNYSRTARTIHKAVKTVAESYISDAAKEIKTINGANNTAFLIPQSLFTVPGRGKVLLR